MESYRISRCDSPLRRLPISPSRLLRGATLPARHAACGEPGEEESLSASRAITIGTFDGVHLGHRALITRAREAVETPASGPQGAAAAPPGRVTVLAFEPNPAAVLRPEKAPARLTTWAQRERLLRQAGADEVIRLDPTPDLLALSPRDFIERVVREHAPALPSKLAIVEGPDFRFGARRSGDVATLHDLAREFGFDVHIVEPVSAPLTDDTLAPARSTVIRWLLSEGRVRDAARLLGGDSGEGGAEREAERGRPHACEGVVVRGARRGRDLGYPTANVETTVMLPAPGVYAGRAVLEDGRTYAAAVSAGHAPMFADAPGTLEAFLLNAPTEAGPGGARVIRGLPEYGWRVELQLIAWLREQLKFDSVDALLAQMARDCDRAAAILARSATRPPTLRPLQTVQESRA